MYSRNSILLVAIILALASLLFQPLTTAVAQDNVPSPTSNTIAADCPATPTPTALLAGDSWAQYMWDDGSHNDIFDKFGHAGKQMISRSLDENPGTGYVGLEYAISGSEAREWVDTANYPWIANMIADLEANPTITTVVLSIDGNDVLAGRGDDGWYKDMDLDVPGSEDALFDRIEADTFQIINAIYAVRPDIEVLLSSYDYPNFNVNDFCGFYACTKREELSRDPVNELITDVELNAMMINVEQRRIAWTNSSNRLHYDNSIGLMHYYYGDGENAPGTLPYPGQEPPDYQTFPGGNPLLPTLRPNFRPILFFGIPFDADPIHLNYDGYQYKISNQTMSYFFPQFRGEPGATFFSLGSGEDGWTDGVNTGTDVVTVGSTASNGRTGLISLDTSTLPDKAIVTSAGLYVMRQSGTGTSPFQSGTLGVPIIDVATGSFGTPAVEPTDDNAIADAANAGCTTGTVRQDDYALRINLTAEGLAAINNNGRTQFRLSFPNPTATANAAVSFSNGDSTLRMGEDRLVTRTTKVFEKMPDGRTVEILRQQLAIEHQGLAEYMGSPRPFLDLTYCLAPDDMGVVDVIHNDDDLVLSWGSVPEAQVYDVWQSVDQPYLTPGNDCENDGMCTAVVDPEFTDSGVLSGGQNAIYYTIVARNDCGGTATSAAAQPVGMFRFALEPGV